MDTFFIDPNVSSSFGYDAIDVPNTIKDQPIHDNYLDNEKEQLIILVTGGAFQYVFFLTKI